MVAAPIDLDAPAVVALVSRCTFAAAPVAVTCAVSGGPDSLALLVLAVAAGCDATAVHVDHGLRVGSGAEAEVVAQVAARLGAAFRAERVEVGAGPNLEARARVARLAVLPPDVLTGHTADDRAESVLLNLMRGAGPVGAVGMARSPRRPLLDLRRSDTVALCAGLGLEPVDDPSNRDPAMRRNRVRHQLLPLLADIGARDPVPVLVRQADLFAEVATLVDSVAENLDPTSAAELAAAPSAAARVAIRLWLRQAGVGDGQPVDAAATDRVLAVACGKAAATEVVGGWRVSRSGGRLAVAPPPSWQDADHG